MTVGSGVELSISLAMALLQIRHLHCCLGYTVLTLLERHCTLNCTVETRISIDSNTLINVLFCLYMSTYDRRQQKLS